MYSIRIYVFFILMLSALPVFAQLSPDMAALSITINLPSRTLELYSNENLIKTYPVAIGKPSTPSPLGNYQITDKEVDPWWYPPRRDYAVPPGPDNPLGYRWMEFSPMYGVHGTNAPWAIGSAVSNGCIRMHEEDVEELFEVIPCGTPVQITYDRVKVRKGVDGELSIGIYPDIYGWREISLDEVKYTLNRYGVNGFLSDSELIDIINEEGDQQIVFARVHTIGVNKKVLRENAVSYKNVMYIPVWPVAAALGVNVEWSEQAGLIHTDKQAVPGVNWGNHLYLTAENARVLFGGQQLWSPEENRIDIDVLTIFLNGHPIPGDVQIIEGVLAVPIMPVADAVAQKVIGRADGEYWVQGRKAPVILIGDVPYIQITKIFEVFRAYVYWNQPSQSIELTYPFRVKDGGD